MPKRSARILFNGVEQDSTSHAISDKKVESFPLVSSENEMKIKFINHLRSIRRSRNLTQQDIAAITGLHYQNVSRFERGAGATLNTVVRYAAALGGTLIFCESTAAKPQINHVSPEEGEQEH